MSTVKYNDDNNPQRFHIKVRRGEISEYVLVPGDPFRCDWIASFLDNPVLISHTREIKIYNGYWKGLFVTCASTGMGCPSTSIVCEELVDCGAKVLLRTGSALTLGENIKAGDIAITTGCLKYEGTTKFFVPENYPAVADIDLVTTLVDVSKKYLEEEGNKYNYHLGISCTSDAFYGETPEFIDSLKKLHIMNLEMESAAVITTAQRHQVRGGCICTCGDDEVSEEADRIFKMSMERQLKIGLDTFVELDKKIKNKTVYNKF